MQPLSNMHKSGPLVSVITATYNRSNVLAYAIESLRRSTYQNWEHWIIGDACTDDTEEVVASFKDERIHFVNLEENFGEQSGPNNEGFRRSKGEYIAYLNHDDLWFPDHLEKGLEAIQKHNADQVANLVCAIEADDKPYLLGLPAAYGREPFHGMPASSWIVRRDLLETVGPWRFFKDTYAVPSQGLLFRAWKSGKKLVINPELTVVAVYSGKRKQAYARREYEINEYYFRQLEHHEKLRTALITEIALRNVAQLRYPRIRMTVMRLLKNLVIRLIFALKQNPYALLHMVYYRRKGGYIDFLRKNRGLKEKK